MFKVWNDLIIELSISENLLESAKNFIFWQIYVFFGRFLIHIYFVQFRDASSVNILYNNQERAHVKIDLTISDRFLIFV